MIVEPSVCSRENRGIHTQMRRTSVCQWREEEGRRSLGRLYTLLVIEQRWKEVYIAFSREEEGDLIFWLW